VLSFAATSSHTHTHDEDEEDDNDDDDIGLIKRKQHCWKESERKTFPFTTSTLLNEFAKQISGSRH